MGACSRAGSTATTTTKTPGTTAATSTTIATSAAEKLYDMALASVTRASSVRYVATSTGTSSGGTTKLRFVADVNTSGGTEVASWAGAGQKGAFTIVVIGSATYLKADAPSLATFFGTMPATDAAKYSGKWISFNSTDKLYPSLQSDMTLQAVSTSLKFLPSTDHPASGGTIVIAGQPLPNTSAPAGEKASATLTISGKSDLPVAQSFSASDNGAKDTSSIQFTEWGAASAPTAPTGSITWDSVAIAIAPAPTTTTTAG
jgi:hypothetical protein